MLYPRVLLLIALSVCLLPMAARTEDDSEASLEAELNAMSEAEAKGAGPIVTGGVEADELKSLEGEIADQPESAELSELESMPASTSLNADDGFVPDAEALPPPPPPPKREYSTDEFRGMSRQEILNYHRDKIHSNSGTESSEVASVIEPLLRQYNLNFGGLAFGDSEGQSIWPTFQFHNALAKRYSIGLIASLNEFTFDDLEARAYTGIVALTYYPQDTYDGIFGRVGAGWGRYYYRASGTLEYIQTTDSINGMATLGWRWLFGGGSFNLGFEAGLVYYYLPSIPGDIFNRAGAVTASVVLPVFFLDIGFAF